MCGLISRFGKFKEPSELAPSLLFPLDSPYLARLSGGSVRPPPFFLLLMMDEDERRGIILVLNDAPFSLLVSSFTLPLADF